MFDEDDDDDDDEESDLCSNKWPLGSDTFPEIYDTRHYGARTRVLGVYTVKKTTGPSHNRVYCFYFKVAVEFSRNSSDIRGNAL